MSNLPFLGLLLKESKVVKDLVLAFWVIEEIWRCNMVDSVAEDLLSL